MITGTIHRIDNLCKYCQLEFATCPKANHIKFGVDDGIFNGDNVIECSEFLANIENNNYPIYNKL